MPFIPPGSSATFVVPAGGTFRVGAWRTTAIVYYSNLPSTAPENFYTEAFRLSNATNGANGPFAADRTVRIEAGPTGSVEYLNGAGNLTDNNYAPNAVVITGGTINGATIGVTTRAQINGTFIGLNSTDLSGTPGNGTANSAGGRFALAAGASSVTITNSTVVAADHVFIQQRAIDTTANQFSVTTGAGSFTVTANATATANLAFDFLVIKI